MKRKLLKSFATAMLLAGLPLATLAQANRTVEQIATYDGADRHTMLLEGAKKEGEFTVYYSHPIVQVMVEAFTKKYGIKAKTWRSGSEAVMQRIMAESKAGKDELDVFLGPSSDAESAAREKLMQEVRSPTHQDLVAKAVPSHRQWAAFNLDVYTAAYNTKLVKKEDLPKSYEDLLDPKWKGKLAVEANDQAWYGALLADMGEERGNKLFEKIIATNGLSIRKGHSLLAGMVAAGEVPLALTVYSWNPTQLKRKNAPIEAHYIQPLYAIMSAVGMSRKAPHPHAAALFYDFVLSDGQKLMAEADYVPTSTRVEAPVRNMQLKIIEPAQIISHQEKWLKMYEEAIIKKAGR
jgi:iron(III) transport system substrate-binding protein